MNQNYFPRGGSKEKPVIQYNRKFVFEKKKPSKSKKNRKTGKDSSGFYLPNFIKLPPLNADSSHFHISYADLKSGIQSICAINGINNNNLFVNLPFGKCAVISNSEISSSYSKLIESEEEHKNLVKMFFVGQLLSCKITKCDMSDRENVKVFATLKPDVVNRNLNSGMIRKHTMVQMAVASMEDHGYFMECGVTGVTAFLPFSEAFNYAKKILGCKQTLPLGTVVWCYVLKSTVNCSGANVIEVTIDPVKTSKYDCIQPSHILWPGVRLPSTITKVFDDGCCQLTVDGTDINGNIDCVLEYSSDGSGHFTVGHSSPATVISYNPLTNSYIFSFSRHIGKTFMPLINKGDQRRHQTCIATVEKVDKKFAYLNLAKMKFKGLLINSVGRENAPRKGLMKKDNEDDIEQPPFAKTLKYEVGDKIVVVARRLDLLSRMYICHLSSGNVKEIQSTKEKENKIKNKRHKLMTADKIKEESDSDIEMSDNIEIKEEEVSDIDNQNDSGINTNKHSEFPKINKHKLKEKKVKTSESCIEEDSYISIKEESIPDVAQNEDDVQGDTCYGEIKGNNSFSEANEVDIKSDKIGLKRRIHLTELSEQLNKKKVKTENVSKINLNKRNATNEFIKRKLDLADKFSMKDVDSNFVWDATPDDLARITTKVVEDFNEVCDEEKAPKILLSKKQKKINELEKERMIREKEEELLIALEEPKSADHYERLILSKPDDSRIWVKYMAFYLEATEIEKARNVGKRALKLISHRNDQDRINIWLALLNLEHLYGSKDLFKDTWAESLKCNDDYKINCKVLDMYANGSNKSEVNNLVQKMTKQYRENSDCWYICLSALMTAGLEDKARDLLQRALKVLPSKSHVTLISRFALLENSFGHSEEGQALFDNLLSSYPARTDIWFVYLDMLIKCNQVDLVRQVFERAVSQKLPVKKMKSIYKKWLEFEEKNGNEESVEGVRKYAMQYVQQASKDIV